MRLNISALVQAKEEARTLARTYTAMVEALLAEGVPDEEARERASSWTLTLALSYTGDEGEEEPWLT